MAELARAIAQERVEFTDGTVAAGNVEKAVYSRLERLLRVMWTEALEGNIPAIRCLLEYMEGKPVQLVAATVAQEEGRAMTGDELARMLADALARLEAWLREASAGQSGTGSPGSSG